MPVQPESGGSSARYSCAVRPTAAAFTRSGRSLLTRTTLLALGSQAARDGQDPGVVVTQPEPGGQHRRVGVVQLDPDAAAGVADRKVGVQAAVLDPQVIEVAQRLPGEVAKLWMMALGLKLGDDNDRQDHAVLGEPAEAAGSASRTLVSRT